MERSTQTDGGDGDEMEETIGVLSCYKKEKRRRGLCLFGLLVLVLLLSLLSLSVGEMRLSPLESVMGLFGFGEDSAIRTVRHIRLPRMLGALLAGFALSLSGVVMQNVLGNPMASPSTLGVSNAAVFGANFAILVLGAGSFHAMGGGEVFVNAPWLVTLFAFLTSLGSVLLLLTLSARKGFSPEVLVLSGVALGALFSAGTTALQYLSADTQVAAALFWSFGELGRISMRENGILFAVLVPSAIYFLVKNREYDAMAGGDEIALSLGVRLGKRRFLGLLFASLLCAVSVSFLGIIGFVGLVAPQMARRLVGGGMKELLIGSALTGASLLLFSDVLARLLPFGITLPVGAVTSLLGAPVFLIMLLRGRGRI